MKITVKKIETKEEAIEFVVKTIEIAMRIVREGSHEFLMDKEVEGELSKFLEAYTLIVKTSLDEQSDEFKQKLLDHYSPYPIEVLDRLVNDITNILPSDFYFLTEEQRAEADDMTRTFMTTVGEHLVELADVTNEVIEKGINNYFLDRDILLNQFGSHEDQIDKLLQ